MSYKVNYELIHSLAEYSLEVHLKTLKKLHCRYGSSRPMAVLRHMKYLFFVLKIKIMYIFFGKKYFYGFFFKVVLFHNIFL